MKPSFILHKDSLCVLEDLTNEQRGELFYAIYCYQIDKKIELKSIIKIAFSQFKNQFVRDEEKFIKTVEARKQAGSKGGKQKVANATKSKQKKANIAVSDSDSVNESVSVSDSKKDIIIKEFTFSLSKQRLLSSTSKEYQSKLQGYIINSGKAMSYEDFYNQCEMKPYKYKNFKMAYDTWNKTAVPKQQPQSFKQQDQESSRNKINAYLDSGYSLRDTHEPLDTEVISYDN